jgi:hypothetical protein
MLFPDLLVGSPTPTQDYKLISVSIQANLYYQTAGSSSVGGRLGKIRAGLILQPPINNQIVGVNAVTNGVIQYPPDLTLVDDLWNPAEDNMPIVFVSIGAQGSNLIDLNIQPPEPIDLTPGQPVG